MNFFCQYQTQMLLFGCSFRLLLGRYCWPLQNPIFSLRDPNLKLEKIWNVTLSTFKNTLFQHFGTWWNKGFFVPLWNFWIIILTESCKTSFQKGNVLLPPEQNSHHSTHLMSIGLNWVTFSQYCRAQYKSWVTIKVSPSSITS